MTARRYTKGFTLIEMVVAIAIAAVVVVFAAMFIAAPVDAYEAHGRRSNLVADASTAWPRMQADLRQALPNSARVRRNGNFVVLEMLQTVGFARYGAAPSMDFPVAGTANGIFGSYQPGATVAGHLSVGNVDLRAYTQTASMTQRFNNIVLVPDGPGNARVQPEAMPVLTMVSPRNRVYLVRGFVAYLCDESQGTMRRYEGTPIVANPVAHDSPAEFAGAGAELVARGLSNCDFDAPLVPGQSQIVTARLTTTRANESVTLMHRATLENLP
jgi:prepilin-type N-terminal cleavage/methylation domain-containing protein